MSIVIASGNRHKLAEIRQLLGDCFRKLYSLEELNITASVEETGATFYENALLKAREACRLTGMAALADDSGLEVLALSGAPGVLSARFSGEPTDDDRNNALLLEKMQKVTDRRAAFVCSVVICFPSGEIITGEGKVCGEILRQPAGEGGFGYDPVFFSYELQKSFAEASSLEKNGVSHRSRALADVRRKLSERNII